MAGVRTTFFSKGGTGLLSRTTGAVTRIVFPAQARNSSCSGITDVAVPPSFASLVGVRNVCVDTSGVGIGFGASPVVVVLNSYVGLTGTDGVAVGGAALTDKVVFRAAVSRRRRRLAARGTADMAAVEGSS